jgi:hypothetical protein
MTTNPTQQSVLNRSSKDKFILLLNLPDILRKNSLTDDTIKLNPLEISVHGTVVPAIEVPSVELRFGGQSQNVSSYSRQNYPPLDVNFIVDNAFRNYWLLWNWLSIQNSPLGSYYSGTDPKYQTYKDLIQTGVEAEYCTTFSIFGLDEYNKKTIEFKYHNAFITSLGAITYSYKDSEFIESTAQFQFSQLDINLLK